MRNAGSYSVKTCSTCRAPGVATGRNPSQIRADRKIGKHLQRAAYGCGRSPTEAHGKEGVCGSRPQEGFTKPLQIKRLCCSHRQQPDSEGAWRVHGVSSRSNAENSRRNSNGATARFTDRRCASDIASGSPYTSRHATAAEITFTPPSVDSNARSTSANRTASALSSSTMKSTCVDEFVQFDQSALVVREVFENPGQAAAPGRRRMWRSRRRECVVEDQAGLADR
jgi:hypothetical protein